MEPRRPALAVIFALSMVPGACTAPDPPPRTEPPPTMYGRGCHIGYFVCDREGSTVLDSTDPLWTFCHMGSMTPSMEGYYADGAAAVTWEYDDAGGIERIDVECLEDAPYVVVAERDEVGRVTRWNENGFLTDLVYDDGGAIVTSSGEEPIGTQVSSYTYLGDGKLDTHDLEWLYEGEVIQRGALDLNYDGDHLVSAYGSTEYGAEYDIEPCSSETQFVREGARLLQVLGENVCGDDSGRSDRTYEWSGEQLVGGTWVGRRVVAGEETEWEEEVRYRYEGDRIAEVQRDRDGAPYATYFCEYDASGRPVHLVWWGHVEQPPPFQ
jgi:hypothetical protein